MASRKPTPGFAIRIKLDTDLGLAVIMVITKKEAKPLGFASTANEARDKVKFHDAYRINAGLGEARYQLWACGLEGEYFQVPVAL